MPEQGPFSEYLTQSAQPRTPQPTGLEGNGASIAYIGSKFLEGLRRGRMERAALAEMENSKTQRAYEQAIHMLDQAKDVDPTLKSQLYTPLMQAYLGHIAGQKESSKDTGHPFTDMVKNAAVNMLGGNLPKAKAPLDMGLVGQTLTALNDPNNKIQNRWLQLHNGLTEAIKSGNIMTQEAVYGLPQYQQLKAYEQATGFKGDDNQIKVMPADKNAAITKDIETQLIKRYGNRHGVGQVPTTGTPPSQPAMTGQQPAAVPTASPAAVPAAQSGSSLSDAFNQAMEDYNFAVGRKLPAGAKPEMGSGSNFAGADGKPVRGAVIRGLGNYGFADGVYDLGTMKRIDNPVPVTPYNQQAGTTPVWSNDSPDNPEVLGVLDKSTGKVVPASDKEGNAIRRYRQPNIQLGTFENADKSQYQAPVVLHRQNVAGGTKPAAGTGSMPASTPPPSSDQDPYWAPSARPVTQAGPGAPSPTSANANPVGPLHKQPTVANPKVLEQEGKHLRSWDVSVEDLGSSGRVNADELRLIRNKDFTDGYVVPTRRNKDKVDAAEKLANNIMPKYKALLDATKGTGALFAWTKGNVLKVFGPIDPKLNGLVDSINAEASNLATTIGGEMRPTDADAERALKAGPDVRKSYEVNQALLNNFRSAVYNALKTATAGAPDEQIRDIAMSRGGEFGSIINQMHVPKKAPKVSGKSLTNKANPFRGRPDQTQVRQAVPEI